MKKFLAYIFFVFLVGCGSHWNEDFTYTNTPKFYTVASQKDVEAKAKTFTLEQQKLTTWKELEPALKASQAYVSKQNLEQVAVVHGDVAITWGEILTTIKRLIALLPQLDNNPELIAKNFYWLGLTEGAEIVGYYEPSVKASYNATSKYIYPLYKIPSDMETLPLGKFKRSLVGQKIIYRQTPNGPEPYYTRQEIDDKKVLQDKGLEIAWLADILDRYFLHVQGGGVLEFTDGTVMHARFAGSNGLSYTSLANYLEEQGVLPDGIKNKDSIRSWAAKNPTNIHEFLYRNKWYAFFSLFKDGPVGSMEHTLSPWISVSVDTAVFPLGAVLVFIRSEGTGSVSQGIGLAQDSGGVAGRKVDIFCGSGKNAERQALALQGKGNVWLLLAK